ncbi:MAG: hypothetical protein ABWY56_01270 [Propionibacteriaceae bacterium]
MNTDPDTDLQDRMAQLEAENHALRHQLATDAVAPEGSTSTRWGGRGRTVVAVVLIVLACLLAPVAVIAGWAKSPLSDTDAFVSTYAPLAHDPAVQAYVVDQVTVAINANTDIDQLTSDVIDGLKALGTRPRASAALDALKAPATEAVQSSIRNGVTAFVTSDAFAQTWERTLRLSHTQLLATLGNDPQALLAAQADGTIGVQLGPIVADVKAALLARGVTIADRIPSVDRVIPIAQSDQIPTIRTAYQLVIALGSWLPWVVLVLLAAGVLTARRWSTALVTAALGLGLSMLVVLLGLTIGRAVLLTEVPATVVPTGVSGLLYDTATAAIRDTAVAGLVLALAVAAVGWLAGPFRVPRRLRAIYADGLAGVRQNAAGHGLTTGRVGDWVYAQRRVLHVIVAFAAAIAVVWLRPLTVSDIVWTLVIAVVVLLVISLVEHPAPAGPDQQTPAPAVA